MKSFFALQKISIFWFTSIYITLKICKLCMLVVYTIVSLYLFGFHEKGLNYCIFCRWNLPYSTERRRFRFLYFYDFISKQLYNPVYFFLNWKIKIKFAKLFADFWNLKNTILIFFLQIVIHFFGHPVIITV